jgi:hypothetical protein
MSKFLHGLPKFSRGPSVVRGPPVGDRWTRTLIAATDIAYITMKLITCVHTAVLQNLTQCNVIIIKLLSEKPAASIFGAEDCNIHNHCRRNLKYHKAMLNTQ